MNNSAHQQDINSLMIELEKLYELQNDIILNAHFDEELVWPNHLRSELNDLTKKQVVLMEKINQMKLESSDQNLSSELIDISHNEIEVIRPKRQEINSVWNR